MVLQELEHEVDVQDRLTKEQLRLDELERQLRHLDAEISDKQTVLRALQRKDEAHADALDALGPVELSAAKRTVKEALDHLRAELRTSMVEHQQLEQTLDLAFNHHWGPLFRRATRSASSASRSRPTPASPPAGFHNFRFYSPNRHFRGPTTACRTSIVCFRFVNFFKKKKKKKKKKVRSTYFQAPRPTYGGGGPSRIDMTNSRVSTCIVGTIMALLGAPRQRRAGARGESQHIAGRPARRGSAWSSRPCPREHLRSRPASSGEKMVQVPFAFSRSTFR